jgi:hypothetical protein
MRTPPQGWCDTGENSPGIEQTIEEWEKQYPDLWILLEVTTEDDGEPRRGTLIATAHDPEDFQDLWKACRARGMLTMLTYGPPREPRPEVVVSAT